MKKNYIILGFMAIGSSIWFFITTNFAVWIIWEYYPKTFEGVISCYILALPFFKNTLLSTLFFTVLLAVSEKYVQKFNDKAKYYIIN